jgi:thiol-disulfide isomerase/thioredoxin
MDQYCVALLLIVFFIIYMDNKNNMEGFTLDSVSAPVGDNAPLQEGGNLKELPKVDETIGKKPQPVVPMPKKVEMRPPSSMVQSYDAVQGAPVGENYMLLSADMMSGIRTTDSNVPMAYPRMGGYGNLGKDAPEFAIGKAPQDLGVNQQAPKKKTKVEITSVYAPWCGWSKKALPDFQKNDKLNNLTPEQSGSLEVSHKLIDSETPEGKKYVKENDVKGFPTVHVRKTDESGKTEVMDGPRGHEEMKKLLNDHGANIN